MIFSPSTYSGHQNFYPEFVQDYQRRIGEGLCKDYGFRAWDYCVTFQQANFQPNDIVLDVGGACSHFLMYASNFIKRGFIIDDNSSSRTWFDDWFESLFAFQNFINGKLVVIQENAIHLPFKGEYFDKIVTFSALEHFQGEDDILASKEIYRVLKTGGLFLGTVDFNPIYEYPMAESPKNRVYTYETIHTRVIKPAGFKLTGEEWRLDNIPLLEDFTIGSLFFKVKK